jgi:hypothetical protein
MTLLCTQFQSNVRPDRLHRQADPAPAIWANNFWKLAPETRAIEGASITDGCECRCNNITRCSRGDSCHLWMALPTVFFRRLGRIARSEASYKGT